MHIALLESEKVRDNGHSERLKYSIMRSVFDRFSQWVMKKSSGEDMKRSVHVQFRLALVTKAEKDRCDRTESENLYTGHGFGLYDHLTSIQKAPDSEKWSIENGKVIKDLEWWVDWEEGHRLRV